VIENGEIIGRYYGMTLPCVHCKGLVEIMVHVHFRKGDPK
jgi:hypothetical protein